MKKNRFWIIIIIGLAALIVYLILKDFMPVRKYKDAIVLEMGGSEALLFDFSDRPALKALYRRVYFLEATLDYVNVNPINFLNVSFYDYTDFLYKQEFPHGVDIIGEVYVVVRDNRGSFSRRSGIALLEIFKRELEVICSFISCYTINSKYSTDEDLNTMNTDIVAKFYSKEGIPLGYFNQGEYHLWKE